MAAKMTSLDDMNVEQLKTRCLTAMNEGDTKTATSYFKEYIELIVFNLLVSDHFFGTFIIHMQREVSYVLSAPAGVTIKKGNPLLVLNPALLLRYTHKEVKAILKHEVYHLLHMHLLRSKENNNRFDSYIENIVMDVAINQFIPDIPNECITFDNFCEMFNLNKYNTNRKEAFEYYLELVKNSEAYKNGSEKYKQMMKDLQDILEQLGQQMGDGQQGQNGNGSGKSISDMIDEILDKKYPVDHSIWKESDSSDVQNMKEIVKHMVNEAAKSCGNIPGELQELIKKINAPTIIKWQDELKRMVGSVRVPYKTTPLRRSRRTKGTYLVYDLMSECNSSIVKQDDRYDVQGRISDRRIKITVAIDTSGSMSEKDLQFVFNEIFAILKLVEFELTIIECDMQIGRVYTASNIKEVSTKVTGRGGTRFQPVFQYLKEELRGSEKPDLLIYFTDGFGESHIDETYRPSSSTKLMWVLTGRRDHLSVDNGWTNKIRELRVSNY